MSGYTVRIRGAATGRREYECPEHGPFELQVDLATSGEARPCPDCGAASERTIAAPRLRIPAGTWVRGKYEAPAHPMALDTRPLAEGTSEHEWRQQRRKKWDDFDRAEMKKAGLT
jgi:hypothetical protein